MVPSALDLTIRGSGQVAKNSARGCPKAECTIFNYETISYNEMEVYIYRFGDLITSKGIIHVIV